MPVPAPLSSYSHVPETQADLPWADLDTVDLAHFDDPTERKAIAQQLIEAVRSKGFLYVKGWKGISQERVDRQFAIGQAFYELPLEEKSKYIPDLDAGEYNGYRPGGRRIIDEASGLRDQTEVYNIPKFNGFFPREHPPAVADNIKEIEQFARDLHTYIIDPLLVLIAIALELPEDFFTNIHRYDHKSQDHHRFMKYSKYSPEDTATLAKGTGVWSQGHTDLGTLTLLFRQPVAALQIQDRHSGQWSWVRPQDGTLTVNTCDALNFLTGGYIQSTIHRVSIPPPDQRHVDRLGLLYFARPHDDVVLNTVRSPVLEREGFTQNELEKAGTTLSMEEWVVKKQTWQQGTGGYKYGAQLVPGWTEKLYK